MPIDRTELHRLLNALPEESLGIVRRAMEAAITSDVTGIAHVALWVGDLERARRFYERWFRAKAGPKYSSSVRPFTSYFLALGRGPRLEIMASPNETARPAHIAVSLGSVAVVDAFVERMRAAGVTVAGEPRWTGDGCYEAVVLDTEGNRVELTV